jgi:energy-converting hydrogenase Eha subunit A
VVEEAELLVRRFFDVVAGFPPEVVAVAVCGLRRRWLGSLGRWGISLGAVRRMSVGLGGWYGD